MSVTCNQSSAGKEASQCTDSICRSQDAIQGQNGDALTWGSPGLQPSEPPALAPTQPRRRSALFASLTGSDSLCYSPNIKTPKQQLLFRTTEMEGTRRRPEARPSSADRCAQQRRFAPSDAGGESQPSSSTACTPCCHNTVSRRAISASRSRGRHGDAPQQPPGRVSYKRFHSEYLPGPELGHGNFSKVYRAVHRLTGVAFALKTNRSPITTPQARGAWVNEMQALAAVQSHPYIVGLYDTWFEPDGGRSGGGGGGAGRDGGSGTSGHVAERAFLKLELCGPSLGERVRRRQALQEGEVLELLWQMASALKRIHDMGMVHLDVKPDNIYLAAAAPPPGCSAGPAATSGSCGSAEGSPQQPPGPVYKLGDFGLAMAQGGQRAGTSEGDSKYLAPETLKSRDFLSSRYADRLDIFALGASAYELLRGSELPKNGQLYHDIRAGKIFLPGSNQRLVGLLKAMMSPEPHLRPSAEQLLHHPLLLITRGAPAAAAASTATDVDSSNINGTGSKSHAPSGPAATATAGAARSPRKGSPGRPRRSSGSPGPVGRSGGNFSHSLRSGCGFSSSLRSTRSGGTGASGGGGPGGRDSSILENRTAASRRRSGAASPQPRPPPPLNTTSITTTNDSNNSGSKKATSGSDGGRGLQPWPLRRPSLLLYQIMHRGMPHPLMPRPPPPCVPAPLGPRLASARQARSGQLQR